MSTTPAFDVRTRELFSTLVARADEQGLWLSFDFNGFRAEGVRWIVQLFDHEENTVVTGRGASLAEAVAAAHERFFTFTMPR